MLVSLRLVRLTIATSTTALAFLVTTLLGPNFAYGQAVQKITIGYPAFSLTFLTFFVAKYAGIFKKNGFDVDLVQLAGAVQTSALVAGEIDYLTGITGPLVAAARGLPFKGIMITHDRPLFWIIGSAEIRKVEDLLGKTVAVDRLATLQDIVARDLIKRKGRSEERRCRERA